MNQSKGTLHPVSSIQRAPQPALRNQKDFICERILNLGAGREPTHIHQSLIWRVWTLHKTRFAGDGCPIRIVAFGRFGWRSGGRGRALRLRIWFRIFWRSIWIKRLLGRLVFSSRFGRVSRTGMSRTSGHRFFFGTSRNKECNEQGERKPQFHNFLGRSLHWFYFNASV